jgi:hypothetical protein
VDSLSSAFSVSNANGDVVATGHLVTAVYQQTGTLDFYYQIYNDSTSTDALHRNTDTDFTGFLTATAFRTNGSTLPGGLFIDGTVAPDLADRKSNSTVGFDFNGTFFGGEIAPGTVSNVILISTNATLYKPGSANVIDGGIASVKAFAPAAVPEPMSFILLGSGLLCLGLLRKKTKA